MRIDISLDPQFVQWMRRAAKRLHLWRLYRLLQQIERCYYAYSRGLHIQPLPTVRIYVWDDIRVQFPFRRN